MQRLSLLWLEKGQQISTRTYICPTYLDIKCMNVLSQGSIIFYLTWCLIKMSWFSSLGDGKEKAEKS